MDGMEVPSDPAPNGYYPSPYQELRREVFAKLKGLSEDEEGWTLMGTRSGVEMSKKLLPDDSSSIPLVKGSGVMKGITPHQFYPIIALPGARRFWDSRFLEGFALQRYAHRSYKFYTIQKGAFLVQPRDFVGYQDAIIEDDGSIYVFQTSVPEDENTGSVKGRTRGTLTVSGWCIKAVGDDIDVTYLVKVNPNGSLPTSVVNMVVSELPQCVVNAFDWWKRTGLLCYIKQVNIESVVRIEAYDHEYDERYRLALIGKGGEEFDIVVDDKIRYKNGYTLIIRGEGKDDVEATEAPDNVHIKIGTGADGKKFEIDIKTK